MWRTQGCRDTDTRRFEPLAMPCSKAQARVIEGRRSIARECESLTGYSVGRFCCIACETTHLLDLFAKTTCRLLLVALYQHVRPDRKDPDVRCYTLTYRFLQYWQPFVDFLWARRCLPPAASASAAISPTCSNAYTSSCS